VPCCLLFSCPDTQSLVSIKIFTSINTVSRIDPKPRPSKPVTLNPKPRHILFASRGHRRRLHQLKVGSIHLHLPSLDPTVRQIVCVMMYSAKCGLLMQSHGLVRKKLTNELGQTLIETKSSSRFLLQRPGGNANSQRSHSATHSQGPR